MKHFIILCLVLLAGISIAQEDPIEKALEGLEGVEIVEVDEYQISRADSISYSVGVVLAQNLKNQGFQNVNHHIMSKAISDVLQNEELIIPFEESDNMFRNEISKIKIREKQMNKQLSEEFLAKNKVREGVITTETGLQYEVLAEGDGPSPTSADKVRVHYHGTLIDGRVFDSSVQRGEPISFGLNQVISAWTEAVPLMKVGSKHRVYCPSNLAYGDRGAGPLIGPNTALIFEIELLGIE